MEGIQYKTTLWLSTYRKKTWTTVKVTTAEGCSREVIHWPDFVTRRIRRQSSRESKSAKVG